MLTEDELKWIKQVLNGDFDSDSNITEEELNWLKQVIGEDYDYDPHTLPLHYVRLKKAQYERNQNKGNVRKELDKLRKKLRKYTPEELLELKSKIERESRGIHNFSGIYIIHNCQLDIYYVGQAEKVFDRVYIHFIKDPTGNPEIYNDYSLGDKFNISLIPLENTSFSSLNELEDNAIRAYNSLAPAGYNRMPGNIKDKAFFNNDNYQKVADLLLDKIKGTEVFLTLTNSRKRIRYIRSLLSELGLPHNAHFILNFAKMIQEYQKANKKR